MRLAINWESSERQSLAVDILVYEHAVAGGDCGPVSDSARLCFLREGTAMLRAVAADFAALPGFQVTTLCGPESSALDLPAAVRQIRVDSAAQARPCLLRTARQADAVILIAPECHDLLRELADHIQQAGGSLISPDAEFIRRAADKHWTATLLEAGGVRVPRGIALPEHQPLPRHFSYPAVVKPRDGAGSTGVRRIDRWDATTRTDANALGWRLEEWHAGLPASVAVLCGPGTLVPLPACTQRLSDDGQFRYLGGRLPLTAALDRRARRLAEAALRALPPTVGYVGIDLVLGTAEDGRDDVVIEINPRYTTSYVGLRKAVSQNLAAVLCDVLRARPIDFPHASAAVEFDTDGST